MKKIIFCLFSMLIVSPSVEASQNDSASTTSHPFRNMLVSGSMIGLGAFQIKCLIGLQKKVNQVSRIPLEQLSIDQLSYGDMQYVSFDHMKRDLKGMYGLLPTSLSCCAFGAAAFGLEIINLRNSSLSKKESISIKNL
ncbi:MAG: hypothetical protein P4L31_01375 [Candidatus Babeliales bacterium]|nr:hypothetical protein [Candidatus Babeliales bacterium]